MEGFEEEHHHNSYNGEASGSAALHVNGTTAPRPTTPDPSVVPSFAPSSDLNLPLPSSFSDLVMPDPNDHDVSSMLPSALTEGMKNVNGSDTASLLHKNRDFLTPVPQFRVHKEKYKCDSCSLSYYRLDDLRLHRRIHLALKSFKCDYCHTSCYSEFWLQKHMFEKGCGRAKSSTEAISKRGDKNLVYDSGDLTVLERISARARGVLGNDAFQVEPSNEDLGTRDNNSRAESQNGSHDNKPEIPIEHLSSHVCGSLNRTASPENKTRIEGEPSRPLPSDSGYHSGLGTDTESVCSIGSDGSSLGLPRDLLSEFIALFGERLIEKAGARVWARYAEEKYGYAVFEERLSRLLRIYTIELALEIRTLEDKTNANDDGRITSKPDPKIVSEAIRLIRRYRPKIARYFRVNALSSTRAIGSTVSSLQHLSKQLSLSEKMGLFDKSTLVERNLDDNNVEWEPASENEDDLRNLGPIQDILMKSNAIQNLTTALRKSLYVDDQAEIISIQSIIMQGLAGMERTECFSCPPGSQPRDCIHPDAKYRCLFSVNWNIHEFLWSQYKTSPPRIGEIITLTGSALYGQAAKCSEYLRAMWPKSGISFLNALQGFIDASSANLSKSGIHCTSDNDLKLNSKWYASSDKHSYPESLSLDAQGTKSALAELAQQISWTGAALRLSPYENKLAYFSPKFYVTSSGNTTVIDIDYESKGICATEESCWLPMFQNASIAYGFPIPERPNESGLEIPIYMMAGIGGVSQAVEYEGGIILKGFSSAFVPTKRQGEIVQWHLISSENCDTRLTYQDVVDRCPSRVLVDEVSLEDIHTTRAIIGWCRAATICLGTECADYENIDYSGAEIADSQLKVSEATLGFQNFGVAQLGFAFGPKDGKCHFRQNGPYRNIVRAAENTRVILYDTGEKRAWLVPASSAILHIAQHRHKIDPFEVNGKRIDLFTMDPKSGSARDVLLENASKVLLQDDNYTFKDLVTNIWVLLEYLQAQNMSKEAATGVPVRGTLRDTLHGFEYKAVVQERSPLSRKRCYLQKSSGGWATLAKDVDAIVLFADGLKDVIEPAKYLKGLCNVWRSVPMGHDYLTAKVNMLADLFDVAGCRTSRKYLTCSGLQWHRGDSILFEDCQSGTTLSCNCNRLQKIVPKSAVGRVIGPGRLCDEGAVVFGQSGSMLSNLTMSTAKRITGLYSLPNLSLKPVTQGQGHEDSPAFSGSESEPSSRTSSNSEVISMSSITSYGSNDSEEAQRGIRLGPIGTNKRNFESFANIDGSQAPLSSCAESYGESNQSLKRSRQMGRTDICPYGLESKIQAIPTSANFQKAWQGRYSQSYEAGNTSDISSPSFSILEASNSTQSLDAASDKTCSRFLVNDYDTKFQLAASPLNTSDSTSEPAATPLRRKPNLGLTSQI